MTSQRICLTLLQMTPGLLILSQVYRASFPAIHYDCYANSKLPTSIGRASILPPESFLCRILTSDDRSLSDIFHLFLGKFSTTWRGTESTTVAWMRYWYFSSLERFSNSWIHLNWLQKLSQENFPQIRLVLTLVTPMGHCWIRISTLSCMSIIDDIHIYRIVCRSTCPCILE